MSTKVYEAYKIDLDKLPQALNILKEFKESKECNKFIYNDIMSNIKYMETFLSKKDKIKRKLSKFKFMKKFKVSDIDVVENVRKVIDSKYYNDTFINFLDSKSDCICFIPFEKICLLIPIFGNKEFKDMVLNQLKQVDIRDFSYWNNSDQPEDITDEEWKYRGSVWNKALTYNGKLSDDSLSYSFIIDPYTLYYMGRRFSK